MSQQLSLNWGTTYQPGQQLSFEFEYSQWKIKEDQVLGSVGYTITGLTLATSSDTTATMWACSPAQLTINSKNIEWVATNKIQKFFLRLLGIQR